MTVLLLVKKGNPMLKIVSIAALSFTLFSCASMDSLLNSTDSRANSISITNAVMTTIESNANKGLITLQSNHSVVETANRLVKVIESKGMKVFAQVDHQKNAMGASLSLRPTQVIMFGNPKAGTPLMNCEQTVAIDLPQKILISEDAQQRVWLSYNDPQYLKDRHNIEGCDIQLENIAKALDGISQAAVAK